MWNLKLETKLIRILTIAMGVYLLLQNGYLQGLYTGYINGAQLGGNYYSIHGRFYATHGDPFFFLINMHVSLSWLLICFLVVKLIDMGYVAELFSLAVALCCLFAVCYVNNYKVANSADESAYIDLLRTTIAFDHIQIWICMVLVILQGVGSYLAWREKKLRLKNA